MDAKERTRAVRRPAEALRVDLVGMDRRGPVLRAVVIGAAIVERELFIGGDVSTGEKADEGFVDVGL